MCVAPQNHPSCCNDLHKRKDHPRTKLHQASLAAENSRKNRILSFAQAFWLAWLAELTGIELMRRLKLWRWAGADVVV
jgi:hypothetical protein